MTAIVRIKKDDFGMAYTFTIEDVNYSAYTAKLYVWRGDDKLVDGESCTVAYSNPDTVVTYIVADGDFDIVGKWDAVIMFIETTTFQEQTETFTWEVLETHP